MRMCYIILSSEACPALQNLFTLSHNQYDLRNTNVCFDFLHNFRLKHVPL
jgi:hypothetical protein